MFFNSNNKTLKFIKTLPISYLHVFTYSERKNTSAIKLNGVVNKKERAVTGDFVKKGRSLNTEEIKQLKKKRDYKRNMENLMLTL